MVFRSLLCICAYGAAVISAAPALVWSGADSSVYTSHEVPVSELFDESANLQIVFLLGRGSDGAESLTRKAPFLSGISQKAASYVHNDVSGVESVHSVVRTAGGSQPTTAVVSLDELGMKFNASESATKKSREIQNAKVLVVNVDAETSPGALDAAVTQAIPLADRVVLTAIRSIDEVKAERAKVSRRRLEMQQATYRRLEDQQQQDGEDNNNNNNQDNAGIYFVQMTPNILAGLLFFFLFATIAYIGISCMGMIAAQDTYVKKMPAVGREA